MHIAWSEEKFLKGSVGHQIKLCFWNKLQMTDLLLMQLASCRYMLTRQIWYQNYVLIDFMSQCRDDKLKMKSTVQTTKLRICEYTTNFDALRLTRWDAAHVARAWQKPSHWRLNPCDFKDPDNSGSTRAWRTDRTCAATRRRAGLNHLSQCLRPWLPARDNQASGPLLANFSGIVFWYFNTLSCILL